jgi:diketogulonate reductase-like aldo/keto reductase
MQYYNKYLKYKNKYLVIKKQLGSSSFSDILQLEEDTIPLEEDTIPLEEDIITPLDFMPQLCFGTAQYKLDVTLKKALSSGIRHIDGADAYAAGSESYYDIIKDAIKEIRREELWITWKSDDTSEENIKRIIDNLECSYIDTFLVHHDSNCNSNSKLDNLVKLKQLGLIRFIGVSNCENIEKLDKYKTKYNIDTIQIQARPLNTRIQSNYSRREPLAENFIDIMNTIGINVMLYGTISGITNSENFYHLYDNLSNINKFYLQKYCLGKPNILMISSITGTSIDKNILDFDNIMNHTELLPFGKLNEIESQIQQVILSYQ